MDLGDQHLFRLALHEIRTPLTAVQLNAQLIERSLGKLGLEKECRLAGTIISAARKLDELTQELGDIARLIRRYPIPAALIGVGLGWFAWRKLKR